MLAEGPRWEAPIHQEAASWQDVGQGRGQTPMVEMKASQHFASFLKVTASTPGSDMRSFSLSSLILCPDSMILVVNGCQLLISWGVGGGGGEQLFTAGVGRSSGPWEVQGTPRQLHWRGLLPESSPISGHPLCPLPLFLCWLFSPIHVPKTPLGRVPQQPVFWSLFAHKASILVIEMLLCEGDF